MPKLKWETIFNTLFSDDEKQLINQLITDEDPWEPNNLNENQTRELRNIKDKIKSYFLDENKSRCCYCDNSLLNRSIETDREHIIPKSHKKALTYNMFNLNISCKRCNMTYKGNTLKHIESTRIENIDTEEFLYDSDSYLIPHPNIEKIFGANNHIVHISFLCENIEVNSYKVLTDKGKSLYELVRLDLLSVNNFDKAQNMDVNENYMDLVSKIMDDF